MRRAYDVVIAGGGVNGCACAYFLAASPDFDGTVAVIERDPTYRDAPSARATGGIRQQFSTPENVRIGLFGADFVKHIGEHLAVDGVAPDVGFRESGYLLLATPEMLPVMRENNALQRRLGASIVLHGTDALASRFPWLTLEGIAGGSFGEAGEGWIDPYSLLQAFRAKARALGVELVTAEVASILRRGARVSGVRLADGTTIGAGSVVDAAGASGAARLAASAGIRLPIESRKRCTFVFTTRTPITGVPLTILPEGLAFRPEGTTFLANLAPPPERDPECFDHEIDHALFEEQIKLAHAWSCHYDFNTFDENAIVGPAGEIENLYLLVGFSGHGLQQSPAMGRATAELIVHGAFRTLDLQRMGYARIAAGEALRESNCY
jgi:FAD-dependent oxidoreductase domain-containing protein 1